MTNVDERVKGFFEAWDRIRGDSMLSMDPLRCVVCNREIEDGGFAILDGDPVCHKCRGNTQKGSRRVNQRLQAFNRMG